MNIIINPAPRVHKYHQWYESRDKTINRSNVIRFGAEESHKTQMAFEHKTVRARAHTHVYFVILFIPYFSPTMMTLVSIIWISC